MVDRLEKVKNTLTIKDSRTSKIISNYTFYEVLIKNIYT